MNPRSKFVGTLESGLVAYCLRIELYPSGHWILAGPAAVSPGPALKAFDKRLTKWHIRLMTSDVRFMGELFRIVNGALRLDIDKVRNYTTFLADKLEKAGDPASAARLRKMLEENDQHLRPAGAAFARTLPV